MPASSSRDQTLGQRALACTLLYDGASTPIPITVVLPLQCKYMDTAQEHQRWVPVEGNELIPKTVNNGRPLFDLILRCDTSA